ncbi:MAG TPA: cytochrome C [Nitrospiraceae bacterium]|nr:cytochrome C [Nitrospiraceae bacterium]
MKKLCVICIVAAISVCVFNLLIAAENPASSEMQMKQPPEDIGPTGEELFKQNCAVCHPEGGNIINSQKNLHEEDRDEFGIRTPEDIIKIMRNPGPGMRVFDENTVSDRDAQKIAEYILKTF